MRPVQQNRRMRGRGNNNNNNNRKGPNPLSRNYESNGPDVKIRGNAQHIAEKYTTLARDAQASGDRVIAENYLQHAEHYNRIIMAAMAHNNIPYQRDDSLDVEGDDEDTNVTTAPTPAPSVSGTGPQPVIEGTPAEVVFGEEPNDGRSQSRDPREQRRQVRGRRPQRERFNSDESAEQRSVEARENIEETVEPKAEAVPPAPVVEEPEAVKAPETVKAPEAVKGDEGEQVAAPKKTAAAKKVAPSDENAEEETPVRRVTRRPGRPRRVVKEAEASEASTPEPASSDV